MSDLERSREKLENPAHKDDHKPFSLKDFCPCCSETKTLHCTKPRIQLEGDEERYSKNVLNKALNPIGKKITNKNQKAINIGTQLRTAAANP